MSVNQPSAQKRVAVVIVNWNGWRETIECIDSLFAQSHDSFHVFIVDNDSRDQSIEHIVGWCKQPRADAAWRRHPGVARLSDSPAAGPVQYRVVEKADAVPAPPQGCRLTLIHSGGNLGFAGGCNVGINIAGLKNFDYFWFLNADTVVDAQALVELLNRAEQQPGIGMVGSTIRYYDTPDVLQAMAGGRLNRSNGMTPHIGEGASISELPTDGSTVERELAYITGASMLVSRRYIVEIGLMEEDYFLYFEDADWALRGSGKFALGFAPRSHVFHKWGVNSHKAARLSSITFFYRNRLRFVTRFLPQRLAAVKRALFEQMLRHLARGRWDEAKVVFSTLMTAGTITASVKQRC
jgi:GT2 family glycosyltransferase